MTHTAGSVDDLERCLANADWEGFVGQLRSLENLEERRRLQEGLGKRHPKQIDLVQRLRAWPAGDSGRAATHLLPALLHAALTIPQLLELLQFAVSAGANVRYRVIEVLRNALSAPSAAWHDIAAAVSTDASLAPALDVWLTAFVQARPADAAAYAIELPTGTSSERELLARFLVLLRPFLASITPILLPHAGRLLSAVLLDAPRDGLHFSVLWSAVRTLAHVHAPAMEALMEASRAGQTPALVALANWLPGLSADTLGANAVPLSSVVDLLLEHALKDSQLRERAVDSNLASLIYGGTAARGTVLQRLHQLSSVDGAVADDFKELFSAIADDEQTFGTVLTEWLLSPNTALPPVRSLLAMCASSRALALLDVAAFAAAPVELQVVACRRILNLSMHGPTLCAFVGMLAQEPGLQPQGLKYASEMLPAAMDEYPGAAEDFLAPRTRADRRHEPYATLYRAVYARALQWRRVLKQLPNINELSPTDSQLHALRAMHRRHSQEVMRMARAQSVFGQLATTVHTAQGRRFVSHLPPGPSGISGMVAQSHSFELPSSERSDPLGGLLRRRSGLRASR